MPGGQRSNRFTPACLVVAAGLLLPAYFYLPQRSAKAIDQDHNPHETVGLLSSPEVGTLEQISDAFSLIAETVKASVVNIEARAPFDIPEEEIKRMLLERGFLIPPNRGTGSGILIDEEGYIVTNNHVIAEAEVLEITLADGRVFRAEIIGTDPQTDIAVIKINAERLQPAGFGNSDRVRIGNLVLAFGSPFRLGHSVSHGIVSALGRTNIAVDIDYQNWIQTDAPINPGNSGGPLLNTRGEVIGLTTAIATETGSHQGVGFAIPSNTVVQIAGQLKADGVIKRGYLGVVIQPITPKIANAYGLDESRGVFVGGVGPNTPAAEAGIQPEDILLRINGRNIESREQLQSLIASTRPETTITLTIWRNSKSFEINARLGAQPKGFSTSGSISDLNRSQQDADPTSPPLPPNENPAPTPSAPPQSPSPDGNQEDSEPAVPPQENEDERNFEQLGFDAATLNPERITRYSLRADAQGVLITQVTPTGEGYAAGLRPGYLIRKVNGQNVSALRELRKLLTNETVAKGVRLQITNGHDLTFYTVLQVH